MKGNDIMLNLPQIKMTGTLSEKTYSILKDSIIKLELEPGALITVEEISEQLGVSRTPIRTALNSLTNEGLIEVVPGKGTFVKDLTKKEAADLFSLRELLESYSISLATKLRTDEDIKKIEHLLHKMKLSYSDNYKNKEEFLTYDSEFHYAIVRISNNSYLEKHLTQLLDNSRRYLNASTVNMIINMAIDEHKELIEQIKNQDVEKAVACMKNHIANVHIRINEYIVNNEKNKNQDK